MPRYVLISAISAIALKFDEHKSVVQVKKIKVSINETISISVIVTFSKRTVSYIKIDNLKNNGFLSFTTKIDN